MTQVVSQLGEPQFPSHPHDPNPFRIVSLFSGVGGLDLGLKQAGGVIVEMCESWEPARRVLRDRFPGVSIAPDVRGYTPPEPFDLLTAGFPCVDLSHAGKQAGIFGPHSGLVKEVFDIAASTTPEWIVLENVPNLLRLGRGTGIQYIITSLENLGYSWAYRVLDSRAFGVPQRRNRVIILASLHNDPSAVLLGEDSPQVLKDPEAKAQASGFYWTEGRRGVGLVPGAVPTLKGGSTLGLPSAPAIWMPSAALGRRIVLPSVEDAEELQGLKRGWTDAADIESERSVRWKLVGNAVTVGLAKWIGQRLVLAHHGQLEAAPIPSTPFAQKRPWPDAAYGAPGQVICTAVVSRTPVNWEGKVLHEVIDAGALQPLSFRATKGFLSRIEESGISLDEELLKDLELHMSAMRAPIKRLAPSTRPWVSPEASKHIQSTGQKNTTPDVRLRRALTDQGLRYRLQVRPEPRLRWRSDIVFKGAKVIVDVRGCFWHVCPLHQTRPKATTERWAEKLLKNQSRDRQMEAELSQLGWKVIVVWEHEEPTHAAARIALVVQARKERAKATTVAGGGTTAIA